MVWKEKRLGVVGEEDPRVSSGQKKGRRGVVRAD